MKLHRNPSERILSEGQIVYKPKNWSKIVEILDIEEQTEKRLVPMRKLMMIMMIGLSIFLCACSASSGSTDTDAVKALEAYLNAFVSKDEAGMSALTCGDWEFDALLEYDAFGLNETTLEGLSCLQSLEEDGVAFVNCEGAIKASYGNEVRDYDLSDRTYRLELENGNWLVCGYDKK